MNDNYCVINRKGQTVVETHYNYIWSYNGGLAEVELGSDKYARRGDIDSKYGYIDRTGKEIWKPTK